MGVAARRILPLAVALGTLVAARGARAQDAPVPPPIEPDLGPKKAAAAPEPGVAPVTSAAPAGAAQPAGTAAVSSSTKAAELPDVVVTANTGSEERLFDATSGMNVVSRQKLEEQMPRYLSDALRWQPGLWASQSVIGQAGTPIIRGLQGAQILLVQDGVRLTNSPGGDAGPSLDFDTIDIANVDHIEVLRSPDSVLYGTQAIGGVVATYTRIPIDFPKAGFDWGARNVFDYASSDFTRRDHIDVFGATPDVRLSLGFTYLDAGNMKMGDDAGVADPTAYDLAAGDFHLEWKPTPLQTFKAWFSVAHKEYDGVFLTPDVGEHSFFDRKIFSVAWRNEQATAAYDVLEVQLSFLRYERSNDRTDIFDDVDRVVQTPQLELKLHKTVFDTHALLYGLHFHLDDTTWTEDSSAGKTAPVPSGWVGDVAGFVQDEWTVLPQLKLTAGIRFDGVRTETFPRVADDEPLVQRERPRGPRERLGRHGQARRALPRLRPAQPHGQLLARLSLARRRRRRRVQRPHERDHGRQRQPQRRVQQHGRDRRADGERVVQGLDLDLRLVLRPPDRDRERHARRDVLAHRQRADACPSSRRRTPATRTRRASSSRATSRSTPWPRSRASTSTGTSPG